MDKVLGKVN